MWLLSGFVSAFPGQHLPAQRPPEIVRDVPAAREAGPGHLLLHSLLVSVILTFQRQKPGMSQSIGEHGTGQPAPEQPHPDWIGLSHGVVLAVHITGTGLW